MHLLYFSLKPSNFFFRIIKEDSPRHNSPHIQLLSTFYYCFSDIFFLPMHGSISNFLFICVSKMRALQNIITPQKHFTVRQCSSTHVFKIRLLWILQEVQEQLWIASLSTLTGAQERVPASRTGGAKSRRKMQSPTKKTCMRVGGAAIRNGLDKAFLTYTTREGITPMFSGSALFSRDWKGLPGAPEKEKYSISCHVKYLWEKSKFLETLSIHTYLHNCKKCWNIWKTSEISENTPLFPKWFHLNKG